MLSSGTRDGLYSREIDIPVVAVFVSILPALPRMDSLGLQTIHHLVHGLDIHLYRRHDTPILFVHQDTALRSIVRQVVAKVDAVLADDVQ